MQSPKRPKSTKTTKKRQTSKEDAFGLRAEPLLEALDSAIFQPDFCNLGAGIQVRTAPLCLAIKPKMEKPG